VTLRVDLNADLGEGGPADDRLLELVTSANVACGQHAGDPSTLRRTMEAAVARGVAVGAHPGYADRDNFGRRDLQLAPAEVRDLVLYQVAAAAAFARAAGTTLQHVKPHGALYNQAAREPVVATAVAEAVRALDVRLVLVGPGASCLEAAATALGLRFTAEVFADRAYMDDGSLAPRTRPDAFVHDPAVAAGRVLRMLREGGVETVTGRTIAVRAETVCVHGDHPGAVAFADAVRRRLTEAGVELRALGT
jgi:5-oxoprolinase (ATP-hydrolysing) subunit A